MGRLQRNTIAAVCVAGIALGGCDALDQPQRKDELAATDLNAIAEHIRQIESQWIREYPSGDTSKLADHYSHDATLMQPGIPAVTGLDRIAASIAESLKDTTSTFSIETEKVEVAKSGDLAYSRGTYKVSATDPKTKADTSHSGSYMTVYKKQDDGTWKAVEDIAT